LNQTGHQLALDTSREDLDGSARHFDVPKERLLQNWKEAYDRALDYQTALGVPAENRDRLAAAAVERALTDPGWRPEADAVTVTLDALRAVLAADYHTARGGDVEERFLGARLDAAISGTFPPADVSDDEPPKYRGVFESAPPLNRRGMVPEPMERRFLRRVFGSGKRATGAVKFGTGLRQMRRHMRWTRVARRRRLLLMALVLIPTTIASQFMVEVLPHRGQTWLEVVIAFFFGALFGWISIGFWTALFGFLTLIRRDRFAITNVDGEEIDEIDDETRTAVVMPVCNEPIERVFAGLKAIHNSLERTGMLKHFAFFVLSDTNNPSLAVKEEEAWFEWCREIGGFDHIFYRRRKIRLKRKSGNVADFCRRWGRDYRYMVMLDADSIMSGDTVARLVQLMERRPEVGMIQTAPVAMNRRSLFARVTQFASQVYGPMFAAGLHYWQLGDGQYWGHNTIIRIEPFMDHCSLPRLPGKPPLGGEIMSHDFVEAALMGRAGWTLWLAYDLGGSYEEVPSTLLEEVNRDRRWCQGNLQHLRLLFTEGVFGAHRALFLNGVLSYVSALLWFAFLTLSTIEAIQNVLRPTDYFPHGASLFPEWPIWRPDWAYSLIAVIAMILFFPKFLSIVLIVFKRRKARAFGGALRLTVSVILEILLSSLLAPIRMVFHSKFVLMNLLGRTVSWESGGREDTETTWREAWRYHGLDTVFASIWGAALFWLNPDYFWWVTPIVAALILSMPLSVYASRVSLGDKARRFGLFVIPEEVDPPRELREMRENLAAAHEVRSRLPEAQRDGFVRAAVDPYANAVHRALLGRRRSLRPRLSAERQSLLDRVLQQGPTSLSNHERTLVLLDPDVVDALHRNVWLLSGETARRWGRPTASSRKA
jgi:membrane glycosyltransferase